MTGRGRDLRVLHVVSSTDRRGAETSALELCRALSESGCEGSTVALAPGSVGGLDLPVLGPSRFAPGTIRALSRACRGHDAVVAHGSSTLPAVALATLRLRTPFLYRSVGDPSAWATTPGRRTRVRAAARRASRVVALWRGSAALWNEVLAVPAERIEVIPNSVPADRFPLATSGDRARARSALDLPAEGPVALILGALSPEKRVDLAIRAVAALRDVTLAVVGDGAQRESLEQLARSLVGPRVRFYGSTEQPWVALAAADVLLLPSDTEGQPAVAIEAGLTGLPVVATRTGGLPEIVLNGKTGVLVEAGDLDGMMIGTRTCIEKRDPWGETAREHCLRNFALERITGKWSELLQSVITG
jgi:glycosyltransferase involved in cell wall biosynthesis